MARQFTTPSRRYPLLQLTSSLIFLSALVLLCALSFPCSATAHVTSRRALMSHPADVDTPADVITPDASAHRALLDKPADVSDPADVITADVSLPDDAVSARKVVFNVSAADGTPHNLAVYVYELSALGGEERQGNGPHVSGECKKNQDTAVVLLHGATYNHKYWDVPYSVDNHPHSLARYLAKLCYLVLAPDMLGTGESDKPDGFTTGLTDQAHTTADMIRSIRTNHNAARAHKATSVIVTGHSFGSIMGQLVVGGNPGIADGFVATGWTNGYEPNAPDLSGGFAFLDPGQTLPYILQPSNFRYPFYYGVTLDANAQPIIPNPHPTWTDAMKAYDDSVLNDYVTHVHAYNDIQPLLADRRSNVANGGDYIFARLHTDQITVPVFMLCGDDDIFANAAGCARGAAFYPNSPSVTSFVQPSIGHVYNLHLDNLAGWEKIAGFVKSVGK